MQNDPVTGPMLLLMSLAVAGPIYFLPTFVATGIRHHNRIGVFFLNLLLGWTVIGWLAALVWALSKPPYALRRFAQIGVGLMITIIVIFVYVSTIEAATTTSRLAFWAAVIPLSALVIYLIWYGIGLVFFGFDGNEPIGRSERRTVSSLYGVQVAKSSVAGILLALAAAISSIFDKNFVGVNIAIVAASLISIYLYLTSFRIKRGWLGDNAGEAYELIQFIRTHSKQDGFPPRTGISESSPTIGEAVVTSGVPARRMEASG